MVYLVYDYEANICCEDSDSSFLPMCLVAIVLSHTQCPTFVLSSITKPDQYQDLR